MSDNLINIISGLIGALAGAGATYYANLKIEGVKTKDDLKSRQSSVALSLRLELQSLDVSLSEMKGNVYSSSFFPLRWVNVTREIIRHLDSLRNELHILESDLQEKLLSLLTDILLFINDVEAIESWQLGLQKSPPIGVVGEQLGESDKAIRLDTVKEMRRQKLVELVDLRRRIDDAIKDLRHLS